MSVIDFHTHVLPEMDDGSKSVDESVVMLETLAKQGAPRVIATPHFYPWHEPPEKFLSRRKESEHKLRNVMCTVEGMPELSVGAEVHFFEGISDCEYLRDMAIEGTDCILIEMPMNDWSDRNLSELVEIRQKQKLIPIVAHIDRYISSFAKRNLPERISKLPVLVQANASFFIKRTTRRFALSLLSKDKIQLLGSDCHNMTVRPPNIEEAERIIKRSLGERGVLRINELENKIISR